VRLYGLRHLRDRQAAADLMQQVLLMTLERLRAGEVREPERIASFVLGACRMTVLEMRRGTRRREELLQASVAYLFKKPELDEATTCLEHELTTYVSEVEVFIEKINKCNQGYYFCEAGTCNGYNCESTQMSICFNKRLVGEGYWGVPAPLACNDENVLVPYCISCRPQQVNMNYINGQPLENGYVNQYVFKTVALLAISLADCIKSWCVCDMCVTDKIKYYRSYEMIKVAEGMQGGAIGDQYRHFITDQTKSLISGLPPYRGLVEAFRNIQTIGCKNLSGHVIGES
jgi:hypothetical protein